MFRSDAALPDSNSIETLKWAQSRPPEPDEEDVSITKASHGPITFGADMDTRGITGFSGAATSHISCSADAQFKHSFEFRITGQLARSIPPFVPIIDPILRSLLEGEGYTRNREPDLSHLHDAAVLPSNERILEHEVKLPCRPMSVEESKASNTDLPSSDTMHISK
jgi:hypothetical protein